VGGCALVLGAEISEELVDYRAGKVAYGAYERRWYSVTRPAKGAVHLSIDDEGEDTSEAAASFLMSISLPISGATGASWRRLHRCDGFFLDDSEVVSSPEGGSTGSGSGSA